MAILTLFSQGATGSSLTADPTSYTMGVQFSVSTSGNTLTGIWFYSPPTAAALPQTIGLYQVSGAGTGTLVHSEAASWSGAAGSGWVRASFAAPPALTASTSYKAVVLQSTAANWYSTTANYWSSGAGSAGITNGVLSAPNNAGADVGQDSFNANNILTYPASTFNATNYWVDPEVTTPSGSGVTGAVATAAVAAPAGSSSVSAAGLTASVSAQARLGAVAVGVQGSAPPNISVAAPVGQAFTFVGTPITAGVSSKFHAYTAVTAQATMEFEAGQPVQTGLITLAEDPWTSMYPG